MFEVPLDHAENLYLPRQDNILALEMAGCNQMQVEISPVCLGSVHT